METRTATAPDGVSISIQIWGNPAGREIPFIHGISQGQGAWRLQVTDPTLAARFRMVNYDLRGHGQSGRPRGREYYNADHVIASDLAAVIDTAGLRRPVLVCWSYGGRVVGDYLRTFGPDRLAGINYVDAHTLNARGVFGPAIGKLRDMQSDNPATNAAATRAFLTACFARPPSAEDFDVMLAYNMAVPAYVRRHLAERPRSDPEALSALTLPVLVTHGRLDQVILPVMSERTAAAVPGARLSLYDDVGHSPFWEDAPRFNAELAAFVGG